MKATLCLVVLVVLASSGWSQSVDTAYFENHIRPVFEANCVRCHGKEKSRGGLRLHTLSAIKKGGDSGPIFAAGKPQESLLIHALNYADPDLQMPPKKKLDDDVIRRFVDWVKNGAPMPEDGGSAGGSTSKTFDLEERKKHWAWQPLADVAPTAGVSWSSHPVDAFIWDKLVENKLNPAERASRRTLIRRVYFDVIGLPPSPADVAAFLEDKKPGAFERVVDRLLESPRFGEKWGRHWLDLVGYSETQGFEYDFILPNAWQYRDYVIRALNDDVPYDRLVREHLAGDLIETPRANRDQGFDESPLGTAFYLFGQEPHSPVSTRVDQLDRVARKIDVVSKAFLGMTVACARCHDHKFDAISTEDYYALAGFMQGGSYRQIRFESEQNNFKIAHDLERLRIEEGPKILSIVAGDLNHGLKGLPKTVGTAFGEPAASDDLSVRNWRTFLASPRKDILSALLTEKEIADKGPFADLFEKSPRVPESAIVVADYMDPDSKTMWLTNGPGFGTKPAKRGDIRLSMQTQRPIASLVKHSGAWFQQVWRAIRPAPRTEKPQTAVNWPQAGRTLKTPSIHLRTGKLHYLVQGEGKAFVEINSHRAIHGPLHGRAILNLATQEKGLQWVTHDLSEYIGQRVHVEFTPTWGRELGVLMVIESEEPPGLDVEPPEWLAALTKTEPKSSERANAVFAAMERAATKLSDASSCTTGDIALINWMLKKSYLLGKPAASKGREAVNEIIAKRRALVRNIKMLSRQACVLTESSGVDEHILLRGSHKSPGSLARRRFLSAIDGRDPLVVDEGSGRLQLAERLTSRENPLFSRVFVNRIWHHIFGRGLVETTDDFGVKGSRPTHPRLLDWLSQRLIEKNYSLKEMIKLLVTSETYQMSSSSKDERAQTVDPRNRLLHRMPKRRLRAEAIRDAILKTSGTLDLKLYGEPVPIHVTPFMQGRGRPVSGPLDGNGRRSIYLSVRLNFLSPFFLAFDFPKPTTCIGRRTTSNVPAQSLALMNDPFVKEQASKWAERILQVRAEDDPARIRQIYLEAFSRPPGDKELQNAMSFLNEALAHHEGEKPKAWADLCHVLFNTKEFWHLL